MTAVHDYRIALQQCALSVAKEAMEAFTDPLDQMPATTGEFNDLKIALVAVRQVLPLCDEYQFGKAPGILAELASLKAANAELARALQITEFAMDDCPVVSHQLSSAITTARAALTKHNEAKS